MAERALAEAEQADRRRTAGEERPLLGVPVAVKDNVDVAGELTTHGTGAFPDRATADAEIVRRLRAAGAVILGKTNLPELAITGSTESMNWGVTRNPWNTDRTCGGSSGGSAAAVAAGLAAAGHATDGARLDSHPGRLLRPLRPQAPARPRLADARRPALARHERGGRGHADRARQRAVPGRGQRRRGGRRPHAAAARPALRRLRPHRRPGRLRIAVSARPSHADAGGRGAARRRCERRPSSCARSATASSDRDPAYGRLGEVFTPRFLKGIEDDAARVPQPARLSRRTRGFARLGRGIPRPVLAKAMRDEAAHAERVNRLFADHDVLMTPITTRTQVRAAEWEGMGAFRTLIGMLRVYPFTVPWNATGQPAASVPAGFTDDGLPLAVQLVGKPGDEGTLLSLAAQMEAERPWADRRPPVA